VALHPFQFSQIERELRQNSIDSIFLTGDFPKGRFVQARLLELGPRFFKAADDLCTHYLDLTPSRLPQAVRYFLALERLLNDLSIRPVLANEIFPVMNLPHGSVSHNQPPPELLEQIPNIISRALDRLGETTSNQNRFSQAVVVDRNFICAVEASGTDALLRSYAASPMGKRQTLPILLKLPSASFNPALDQPTIGLNTISECERAGIEGILVCAETTVVGQKAATIEMVNRLGMFLYAIPFNQLREIYLQRSANSWVRNAPIGPPQP
jgi:DUF1009 family protein